MKKMVSVINDEVNIFELSYEELQDYNAQKYNEFKEIFYTTNHTIEEIFNQLHINKGDPTYRYITNQYRIDKLKRNNDWDNNVCTIKTPLKINKTPEQAYQEYKNLFYNSELSIRDIYDKIGVPQTQNTHYTYIREQAKKEGLNGYSRRLKLKHGGRPKGSKDIKGLTGTEKEKHNTYFEEKYQEFLKYYNDINLSVQDILKKMGTHHKSNMYFYFRRRLKEDGLDIRKRQGKVIGTKVKKTYDERRKINEPSYEERFQEYKRLFNESTLSIKEIYEKINVNHRSACAQYIHKRCKEEGLNGHSRRFKINPLKKVTPDELKIREELYQEYKRLFYETTKPVGQIYKKLNITQSSGRGRYVSDRAKEEGLDSFARLDKIRKKNAETTVEMKSKYQKYKDLFNNSNYPISEIYDQLNVKPNSPTYNFIRKHAREDGLNGKDRRSKLIRNKVKPIITSKQRTYQSQYSENTIKCVESSKELLEKVFLERNIKSGTQKGYLVSISHWFEYHEDKYRNLRDNIDFYINEEDERIPMRERSIKKDLIGFREYLLNLPSIESNRSLSSYFSKIGSVFRHFGLEMPTLPPVKMEKGYVSNYNDLPTHEMIKTACDQSPLSLKSLILFMSSSGSAKAESLSITIGMFLKGCEEYTNITPTQDNINDIINELNGRHDIVPLIYLRRIKTDKWYYTCCSPEASYVILEYLSSRDNLKWDDKLFPFKSSLVLTRFQEINDTNKWGRVGHYRRFRGHALRKFMASNIGLPRDQVDSFQGRSKDMIQEAYFKQDPEKLKRIYLNAMSNILIYDNWGHDLPTMNHENTSKSIESLNEDNQIINKQSVKTETEKDTKSVASELLDYAKLMDMGLLTEKEFQQIKKQLLGEMLN